MEIDESAPGNMSQQVVTRTTDNETGHTPRRDEPEVPLPPEAGSGRADDPDADPQMNDQDENYKEARDEPASDPESGA